MHHISPSVTGSAAVMKSRLELEKCAVCKQTLYWLYCYSVLIHTILNIVHFVTLKCVSAKEVLTFKG